MSLPKAVDSNVGYENMSYAEFASLAGSMVKKKLCLCGKTRPTLALPGQGAVCCKLCREPGMVDVIHKRCRCDKALPSFAPPGQKPVCCKSCREFGMVNVIHARCRCGKARPSIALPGQKPVCCKSCKTHGMVNVVTKRCRCRNAIASFALPGQRPVCCKSCKEPGMAPLHHETCVCGKARPSFALSGHPAVCCKACKAPDMVDVVNTRCRCGRAMPTFAFPGEARACCKSCRETGMVDVVHDKCLCGRAVPLFALPGQARVCCKTCKTPDMVDVITPRCRCGRVGPVFAVPGQRAVCCRTCRDPDMVDVVNPRCIACALTSSTKKYDWHCLRCFVYLFPDRPNTRNYRVKEGYFVDVVKPFLESHGIQARYDKRVCGGSSLRRPDVFFDLGTHFFVLENDEEGDGHDCNCANKRLCEIFTDVGQKPGVYLHFNGDAYTTHDAIRLKSCYKYHKASGVPFIANRKEWDARISLYMERLTYHMSHIPDREMTVEHLFFNGFV